MQACLKEQVELIAFFFRQWKVTAQEMEEEARTDRMRMVVIILNKYKIKLG